MPLAFERFAALEDFSLIPWEHPRDATIRESVTQMSTQIVRRLLLAAPLLVYSSLPPGEATAQEATADARTKDREAIANVMQSLAKSFEARDARQLAHLWTVEGEYENDRGISVHGREALEEGFAALFAKTPELTVEMHSKSLRFLSANSAIEEGTVLIRRGAAEPITDAEYSALLIREGDNWQLAQLSDSSIVDASIEDLAWLIGDWKTSAGEHAEILTTYAWNDSKKFIRVHFSRIDKELALSGDQVIGVDPATGQIHAWVFEAAGGVGETQWERDGDHWTLAAAGTLTDGKTLVETNLLRRVDNDSFTWQSIGRALDDVPLPDLPPVRVERVKPQK